jgi:predicted ArsR family transcriptional regulator
MSIRQPIYAKIYLHKSKNDDKMTNVMTKQTSRQRILAYLRDHNGVSADEMSRALRVTASNIRHHLSILVSDGRVKNIGARPGNSRGRPVQIYGLSDAAVGDNLAGLADALLSEMLNNVSPPELEELLKALAARLAAIKTGETPGYITRRLALTIEQLNRLGYASRWEAHASGPRVIFEHCPYAVVIGHHPELCQMDAFLLVDLLKTGVTQLSKLELNTRGLPFCMFVVGETRRERN